MDKEIKKVALGDMINETFNAMFMQENKDSSEKKEEKKKK